MRRLPALAALAAAWLLVPAGPSPAASVSAQEFQDVVQKLRANADLWATDQNIDVGAEIALKSLPFDATSVRYLIDLVRATPIDANDLYVVNRLLRQLTFAPTEPIRLALPAVRELHARARKAYRALPSLSKEQVAALKEPSSHTPEGEAALAKRRAEKIAREKRIAKHNEMICTLERRAFVLMLLAGDTEQDKALADWLLEAEKERSAIFLAILDAIADDARKMSTERGKNLFTLLRPPALELKYERKRSYVDAGKAILRDDDASEFEHVEAYPGIRLLTVMNRLATAGRMPALKVPKPNEVDAQRGQPAARPRQRPRQRG